MIPDQDTTSVVRRDSLPKRSHFVVRRYHPKDYNVIEEVHVAAHAVSEGEHGSICFVDYQVWNGQAVPTKHRIFSTYIDVEEIIVPKSNFVVQ